MVKGDEGTVGLMQNPAALRRWLISEPKIAGIITEFEADTAFITDEIQKSTMKRRREFRSRLPRMSKHYSV